MNSDAFNEHLHVLAERRSPHDMVTDVRVCEVPITILAGTEDDGLLEPSVWLKHTLPGAGLVDLPRSGHVTNLAVPELINGHVIRILDDVQAGK